MRLVSVSAKGRDGLRLLLSVGRFFVRDSARAMCEPAVTAQTGDGPQVFFGAAEIRTPLLPPTRARASALCLTGAPAGTEPAVLVFPCERRYALPEGEWRVVALFEDGHPAIAVRGRSVHVLFDLGEAFFDLLTEGYAEPPAGDSGGIVGNPVVQWLYYRFLPHRARRAVQKAMFARIEKAVEREKVGGFRLRYPCDSTAEDLLWLVGFAMRQAGGEVRCIRRWPPGYPAALLLTHDIEPTGYAYGPGLDSLLARLDELEVTSVVNLVAERAARHLRGKSLPSRHAIGSHGLVHDGRLYRLSPDEVERRIVRSVEVLADVLQRPIVAHRAPRLQRPRIMFETLHRLGLRLDLSLEDVDDSSPETMGRGVSLSYPYRYPVGGDPSSFWECPTTAPMCVTPVFRGQSWHAVERAFCAKLEYAARSGSLFTLLVHGGVFGPRDSGERERLLSFVVREARARGFWIPDPSSLIEWLDRREAYAPDGPADPMLVDPAPQPLLSC